MKGELERVVNCPNCKRGVKWDLSRERFLPFCSKRCSLIDLGAWASEEMVISGGELKDVGSDPDDVI